MSIRQMTNRMDERLTKRESIISFYDSIADKYDHQLTEDDKKAREEISTIFRENVPQGTVLDIGCGTGLDLPWLLSSGYDVIALEPSDMMRNIAMKKYSGERVHFVEKNLNFKLWSEQQLPFDKKLDGLLANFAVLNCIKDVRKFFDKAALLCKPNAHAVITIINPVFASIVRNYSPIVALRLVFSNSLTILNKNEGIYHETYLHTITAIRRACQKDFDIKSITPISFSNFMAMTLSRK